MVQDLYSYQSGRSPPLTNTQQLIAYLQRLLVQGRDVAKGTTKTAYRRVHDVIVGFIERGLQLLRAPPNVLKQELVGLYADAYQCLLFVEYQAARDQLGRQITDHLRNVLNQLLNVLNNVSAKTTLTKQDIETLRCVFENTRRYVDTLAVIVYRFGKKG